MFSTKYATVLNMKGKKHSCYTSHYPNIDMELTDRTLEPQPWLCWSKWGHNWRQAAKKSLYLYITKLLLQPKKDPEIIKRWMTTWLSRMMLALNLNIMTANERKNVKSLLQVKVAVLKHVYLVRWCLSTWLCLDNGFFHKILDYTSLVNYSVLSSFLFTFFKVSS